MVPSTHWILCSNYVQTTPTDISYQSHTNLPSQTQANTTNMHELQVRHGHIQQMHAFYVMDHQYFMPDRSVWILGWFSIDFGSIKLEKYWKKWRNIWIWLILGQKYPIWANIDEDPGEWESKISEIWLVKLLKGYMERLFLMLWLVQTPSISQELLWEIW